MPATPETARDESATVAHTPGPWTAHPCGREIWQIDAAMDAVATTLFCYADETEANVRLMAAAPDLLAALRLFLADDRFVVSVGGNPNAVVVMMAHAHAALAKAEGRS